MTNGNRAPAFPAAAHSHLGCGAGGGFFLPLTCLRSNVCLTNVLFGASLVFNQSWFIAVFSLGGPALAVVIILACIAGISVPFCWCWVLARRARRERALEDMRATGHMVGIVDMGVLE